MSVDRQPKGPIEAGTWEQRLPAYVASAGPPFRIRGYQPIADLGSNYDFAEYLTIVLGAPPPSKQWGVAINLALVALGTVTVADAPVHAATLSARFHAPARVALTVGVLGLTEQASALLDGTDSDQPSGDELWDALPPEVRREIPSRPTGQLDLALTVLRHAGLRSDAQLLAVLCIARLPVLAAEVDAAPPGDLKGYPMRLPDFEYREDT